MTRGFVRFCVRHNLVVQDLLEEAKVAFVETAEQELHQRNETVTLSRISLMTGLHRKDVKRILAKDYKTEEPLDLAGRVICQWAQDKRFQDKKGVPRPLTYSGDSSEFTQLVSLLSSDVKPSSVLFELERLNAVKVEENRAILLETVKKISSNADEGFRQLARDVQDLMGGVEENILEEDPVPNLHARTEYDNIYGDHLPEIREWLLREGSHFHRRVREYLAKFDKDINPDVKKEGGARVVVGLFSRTKH